MSSGNEELMRKALADLGQSVLSNWEKKDREIARLRAGLRKIADGDPKQVHSPIGPLHAAGIIFQWEIDAKIAREALADSPVEATIRPPHWTCKTHGDFNAMQEVGCPECTRLLRQALLRAFDDHGHRYNCSAARGPHSDCTCGWLEVMELVKQMRGEK